MISHPANQRRMSLNYFQLCPGANRKKKTTSQIYPFMNDVVKGWNVPSISRTCCGLSQEIDSGKDLQLPPIIHVSDRNTNQIVLVKHFLYHQVVEPDNRGLLVCP